MAGSGVPEPTTPPRSTPTPLSISAASRYPKAITRCSSIWTGEWGLDYDPSHDLGRVKMDMSKPPKPIETYKMTLSSLGANKAKLRLEWENTVAEVPIAVK